VKVRITRRAEARVKRRRAWWTENRLYYRVAGHDTVRVLAVWGARCVAGGLGCSPRWR